MFCIARAYALPSDGVLLYPVCCCSNPPNYARPVRVNMGCPVEEKGVVCLAGFLERLLNSGMDLSKVPRGKDEGSS